MVGAACAELEARRQEVNDLNVFPVADGDTGDNMVQTLRAVMQELDRLNGQPVDDIGRDEIVKAVARAALLGARGNSGVILSQVVRGAAEELSSRPGELVDPQLVSAALASAAQAAYESVRDPAEGTMITVVREMSHRLATDLAHMPTARLDTDATDEEQNAALADVLERALQAAEESVERGPELLPVLREHGVVDAGGYGLTLLIAGAIAALRGGEAELPEVAHQAVTKPHEDTHESSRYRFCTNFVVLGAELPAARTLVPTLEDLGDSVLVVGDRTTLRVHVHTDEPESAVAVFDGVGSVERLDVADMHEQEVQRAARLTGGDRPLAREMMCGVVAVAAGPGMRRLFEQLGAHVVDGGPTLNPSTFEILAGIHEIPAPEVIVLPNSGNVILAAERAAELSEKEVAVVDSRWPQAGLACLVEHDPQAGLETNAHRLRGVLDDVATGAVAAAARDDKQGRFRQGDAVGFVGDELVVWGDPQETLRGVVARLSEGREIVTCVCGADAPLGRDAIAALAPDGVELEVHEGGQPHYWWLIAAE
ncbi:MAG TPA: DAK2 domain-containing protein [Solirubrobacterales bacterium]|nr:DAK2 domain-containing protein [Solirubrobacterales bacterium]